MKDNQFHSLPKHVAIIMDGNGRWAKEKKQPRIFGHTAGVESVREITEEAARLGVRYLTLYAFSTENWRRSAEEVAGLMNLLAESFLREQETLLKNNIRLRAIGILEKLPKETRDALEQVSNQTKNCSRLDLILALSYGGRSEICQAMQKIGSLIAHRQILPSDITEDLISQNLYTAGIPDPDLLIRTSNEQRISNFLLWQSAYAEIIFTPTLWPEFRAAEFRDCLLEYQRRERRFGQTSEQVSNLSSSGVS
ncbi:MAG TPA: isoprenyl transferase [Oligoflexia bacterium]|nr:isoprenyl transferase [Oligoflexia bacterium]HMP27797.1 isoprenyl transferase [Oligoflexia bacterium]